MKPIWLLIINPNAGKSKGKMLVDEISRNFKQSDIFSEIVFTNYKNHTVSLVDEYVQKGFRHFIIAGGDGSINEITNGILLQKHIPSNEITLAVIPIGTGNDWIRSHGIPCNIHDAIQLIRKGKTAVQDAGKISFYENETLQFRYFANNAGLGFDSYVVENTNKHEGGSRGLFLYLSYLLKCLIKFKPVNFSIDFDDEKFKGESFSFCAGIGKYNGGGMMPLPLSETNDGLLDISVFMKMKKWEVLVHLGKLYSGKLYSFDKVKHFRSKKIVLKSNHPQRAQIDGELVGTGPFTLEIIPSSIRFITGK